MTSILLIAFMTVLVSLSVFAQSTPPASRVIVAETTSSAPPSGANSAKPKAASDTPAKPKANSTDTKEAKTNAKADAKPDAKAESKAEPKTSPAPPLASVLDAPPKEDRAPFKLKEQTELASATPSAGGLLLRTFGALLLIVGLIAAAGWGLRYFGLINFGKQQSEAAGLKVLDTVPLGERRTLTIVKFGERTLLIGSTPQGLTLLAEQAEEPEPQISNAMPPVRTVTDLLDVNVQPQFEQELARASLINTTWSDRRVQ